MATRPMLWIAGLVAVTALGAAYYLRHRGASPTPPTTATPPPIALPDTSEPAIEHPVPNGSSAPSAAALPALSDSDPALRDALGAALGNDAMQYLVLESIVRHLVVTIDNLPRPKVPAAKRPTVSIGGPFLALGDEAHATIDARNYARYQPMVKAARTLDMQRVADVYFKFYPLFQRAYQDLGYPDGYFNDRLVAVIDSLLATPSPQDPIELVRPNVMYVFADPALEALPAGQKLLIRMGPENAAVIEAKLKELRAIITAVRPGTPAPASAAGAAVH